MSPSSRHTAPRSLFDKSSTTTVSNIIIMKSHFIYSQNGGNGGKGGEGASPFPGVTAGAGEALADTFVNVSEDNRVHVWDVITGKERHVFTEKQHLSHRYNSTAWGTLPFISRGGGSGGKNKGEIFAVSANDGTVILWDLARGVVSKVIGVAGEGPVASDVAFTNDGGSILVAYESSLVRYCIESGQEEGNFKVGKRGVTKISVNPHLDVVAVASSQVRLVDITSKFKIKFAQHFSGGVTAMQWSPCGRYLVCSGGSRREVVCFDTLSKNGDVVCKEPIIVVPVEG